MDQNSTQPQPGVASGPQPTTSDLPAYFNDPDVQLAQKQLLLEKLKLQKLQCKASYIALKASMNESPKEKRPGLTPEEF